ncbi:MAG TPA: hypothetical protein VIN57_03220 [Magnetovibrio sp.]
MTENTPTSPIDGEKIIREELEKAASLIYGARRLMAEGRSVDLHALEERVRTITSAVQSAPSGVQEAYKEHLGVLVEILDALERDIEDQHKALEEGLKSIKLREAHGAYGSKDKT